MKYKTGLIAVGVLAAATALMVFFVLPNINERDAPEATQQAAQPANETPPAADAKQPRTDSAPDTAAPQADGKAASDTANANPATAWQAPSFDLLRVEPDGSTVIAGHAEPNKALQILSGETVVATTDVGPSGDFAAVFDKPLAAGDHELTLRILGEGGSAKTSEEVATVSIPKDGSGELLAMVTKPGSASRLITVLQGPQGTAKSGVATTQDNATDTAVLALPEAGAVGQTSEATGSQVPTGGQADLPNVRISAVELEGDKMFVAGTTKPDALVRIYANDKLLGEIKSDPQGRYVVDGQMSLPVGRHTIRADVMSQDGAKVELRASVPFDRPEGEQVAVVAQDNGAADQVGTLGLIDDGAFEKLRAEANKAVALLSGLYANGRLPSAEELAAARSATEIALQSLAAYKAPPGGPGEVIAARVSAVAADALAKLKALPADAATLGQSIAAIEASVKDALTPATNGNNAAKNVAQAPAVDIGKLESDVAELNSQFSNLFAEGSNAKPDAIQASRSALATALGKITGYSAPTGMDADRLALVDKLKAWAKSAEEALAKLPADASKESYAEALATLKAAPEVIGSSSAGAAAVAESQAGASAVSSATDAQPADAGTQPGAAGAETQASVEQPTTVEQAPLKESKTSVIIRRGDTLWQIARRVYGQGVRYTSIYLANEDQIINPDRILPGQIFGVPDEAMPEAEAEEMHRKRLKGD